jgi:CheY-like chemotaxis protein
MLRRTGPARISSVKPTGRSRIRLIHWNAAEAKERAALIRALGHDVRSGPIDDPYMRDLRADPPDAIVIDMTRIPSQGRDIGIALRQYKQTRRVPLVFVGGDREKIARVRELLSDAGYCSWRGIRGALRAALRKPPEKETGGPVVPDSRMAGYSGATLPKKLGIKAGSRLFLIDPPDAVEAILGPLPDGVVLEHRPGGSPALILWFVRSRRALEGRIAGIVPKVGAGGIWICWPKKTSALASDLGQAEVRAAGLASGIVDYKVCAIDPTWSGLKFARRDRKPKRPR